MIHTVTHIGLIDCWQVCDEDGREEYLCPATSAICQKVAYPLA
jgi:hypothetical protein